MNSILATEPATPATDEKPAEARALSPLETAATNERMRHVPTAEWMARKVESDVRTRLEKLLSSYADLPPADPRHPALEAEFRGLCRALERLIDCAKPGTRHNGHSNDLAAKIEMLLSHAVTALHSLEPTAFGRRNPYHLFERSKSEIVYGVFLAVLTHVDRIITLVRTVDPAIDERLLEGLAVLQTPVASSGQS